MYTFKPLCQKLKWTLRGSSLQVSHWKGYSCVSVTIKSPEDQRRLTSGTGGGAFGPGQVVPGEAHLIVATSCALDGHVELEAYSHVLFLKEDLQRKQQTKGGERKEKE